MEWNKKEKRKGIYRVSIYKYRKIRFFFKHRNRNNFHVNTHITSCDSNGTFGDKKIK